MTRARNIAGFSTITTTPSPVHVGPIGVLTATRIDGEFNLVDLDTRDITAQGIGVTNLQVSGITTGMNVSGIITAQNGINFNGTSTGLNASGVGTIATLNVTGNATIDGNATIGGVLTYEDVTNVDSVGIVTARGLNIFGNTTGLNVASGISTFQAVTGTTGTFSGAVSGTTGTFTSDVTIAENIVHAGDTNTLIKFPAADTVSVETSGSERIRIASDGAVGIGSNSPDALLDITADSGGAKLFFTRSNTAANTNDFGRIEFRNMDKDMVASVKASRYSAEDDAYLKFETQTTGGSEAERMRIMPTGQINIAGNYGQTTYTLSVTGTINATSNITQNGTALATSGKAIAMAMVFG